MRPFTYPRPVKPEIVRLLDAVHKTFNDGMRMSNRSETLVDGLLIATRALITEQEIGRDISDEDRKALAEYNRQVTLYNKAVEQYRAELKKEQDEILARRKTLEIRRTRCNSCFMLHAPGQTECE